MPVKIGCPHCGATMDQDSSACPKCGQAPSIVAGLAPSEFALMAEMTDQERLLFQTQMQGLRKTPSTAVLLAIFLGGIGGHHFYMGNTGIGVVYILLCWTFLPMLFSLVEAFLMPERVRRYNIRKAQEVAAAISTLSQRPAR